MEINVVGRHMDVPERFRRHLEDKLEKVTQLAPDTQRVEVEMSHEANPRQAGQCDRVELTVRQAGTVIRSEARADDPYAALDVAYTKLLERLRRARDRRKDHRRGRQRAFVEAIPSLRTMETDPTATLPGIETTPDADTAEAASAVEEATAETTEQTQPESPLVIREKKHRATPMTVDDALNRMELVGHDFYLFIDAETGHPKVVYRRKGWNYGVIELETDREGTD